jgi:hypothetical protein
MTVEPGAVFESLRPYLPMVISAAMIGGGLYAFVKGEITFGLGGDPDGLGSGDEQTGQLVGTAARLAGAGLVVVGTSRGWCPEPVRYWPAILTHTGA